MSEAFCKLVSVEAPVDSAGWPSEWPWPWPDTPVPSPTDPPLPPLPPSPGGGDDAAEPEDDPYNDTYRFTHIVKAIDERQKLLGLSASGLSTSNADRLCTYANINTARGLISGFYNSFQKSPSGKKYNASLAWNDGESLLKDTNIGGYGSGESTWTNFNSSGNVSFAENMTDTDTVHSVLFSDMESVLKKLIRTVGSSTNLLNFSGHSQDSRWKSTTDQAWADIGYTQGSARTQQLQQNWVKKPEDTHWAVGADKPDTTFARVSVSVTSSGNVSCSRTHMLYVADKKEYGTITPRVKYTFFDQFNAQYITGNTWTLANSGSAMTSTVDSLYGTKTSISGALSAIIRTSASVEGVPPADQAEGWSFGIYNPQYLSVVEYSFTADSELGSFTQ
ncbi:MAG: hypothetical protein KAG97_05335 [Victivallales bacterium]|nr:hypothetical protein [Victivallales bacterium]